MSGQKVLLISPNRMKPGVTPVAIDYLAESLGNQRIDVDFLDLSFSEDVKADIARAFSGPSFVAVGVTIRNLDDSYFASQDFCLKKSKDIIDLIKLHANAPLVLGGIGFSIAPIPALQYCDVDFGIWGEGEQAFPLLVKAFAEGKGYEKIPGLLWKDRQGYRKNPASYLNLQKVTLSRRGMVDNLRYFHEGGMVGFESKRGCDQACHYCADPIAKGRRVRVRSPEDVARELEGLAARGISCFHTCDSEFNVPQDHALEVCKEMVRKKLGDKITWYAYASPFGFSKELAHWMRKAGCVGIDFGVDSGNELMLKNLGRNHTTEDIRVVAKICHNYNFAFMFDLLVGGPGETRETVQATIDLMKGVNPSRVGISLGIRIYAGTYFGKTLEKTIPVSGSGFFGNMSEGMLRPLFYLSPALGESVPEFVRGLVAGDDRFLFGGTENIDENYNYNDNTKLIQAIKKGYRGAFWDILRRVEEKKPGELNPF
jgi:radical SAM superfamily enzyme YgiQ (UPF0313 family)